MFSAGTESWVHEITRWLIEVFFFNCIQFISKIKAGVHACIPGVP